MAKKQIKAECESNNEGKGNIVVRFAVALQAAPAEAGGPARLMAHTIIVIQSTDEKEIAALSGYKPGVTYTLTIE